MELKPREELLVSIAEEIKDYREGELPTPTPEHVDRWISQFDKEVQLPLLNAFDRNYIYLSRVSFKSFFEEGYLKHGKLAGTDPKSFWQRANILDIQRNGRSQHDILGLVKEGLKTHFDLDITQCGGSADQFFYFDDVLFSGSRVRQDLEPWIKEQAPEKCSLTILTMATHTSGEWYTEKRLVDQARQVGKKVEVSIWRGFSIENTMTNKDDSEVLWPTTLPDSDLMKQYLAREQKYPFQPRVVNPHSSREHLKDEEERNLLEQEFLIAGLRIRSFSQNPKEIMRPLGFSQFGLGFGSMIVTYRNCPNNCPLALWWGDPRQHATGPLSKWYALFPRRTYAP